MKPKRRRCGHCDGHLPIGMRADARYCGTACRVAAMRARRHADAEIVALAVDRLVAEHVIGRGDGAPRGIINTGGTQTYTEERP